MNIIWKRWLKRIQRSYIFRKYWSQFIRKWKKKEVTYGKIEGLDKDHQHWRKKALDEPIELKEKIYKRFSEFAKLQADKMKLENNKRPISEEGIQILNNQAEESDLGRLERFKKWEKENLIGLSVISISIAGIITTIIIGARRAIKQGANALGSLGKALANLAKKLGPLLAPLLNLISQILTWGAKGIAFLAKNLWILAIALAYFLYNRWKEYCKDKKK